MLQVAVQYSLHIRGVSPWMVGPIPLHAGPAGWRALMDACLAPPSVHAVFGQLYDNYRAVCISFHSAGTAFGVPAQREVEAFVHFLRLELGVSIGDGVLPVNQDEDA